MMRAGRTLETDLTPNGKREGGSSVESLHEKWSIDPEYRAAYDELGPEFDVARAVILARKRRDHLANLTKRMDTTESA